MPNYIQLVSRTTNEPEDFNSIDEKLCDALGGHYNTVKDYYGWYDVFGRNSIQKMMEHVEDQFSDDEELPALAWLDENFTLHIMK